MRKLVKILPFHTILKHFPRQNYSVYRHIRKNSVPVVKSSCAPKLYYNFSTLSTPQDVADNNISELCKEFDNPKSILLNVLNEAFLRDQSADIKHSLTTEEVQTADSSHGYTWRARLLMKWPEEFEIEGLANRKSEALNICYLQACQKLKEMGVLDSANKPIFPKRKYNESDLRATKSYLLNVFERIWRRSGDKTCIPKFNTELIQGEYGSYWQTELHLSYPEKRLFKSVALRSSIAEGIAANEALSWLNNEGIINRKCHLLDYSRSDEKKLKDNYQAPYSICIPPELQKKMQTVLDDIARQKSFLTPEDSFGYRDPIQDNFDQTSALRDLITESLYYQFTDQQLSDRSRYLFEKNKETERKHLHILEDVKKAQTSLPISQKREDILKLIDENQVVVLSGDTGCGKSTQVPQFILDHYINNMNGAKCNIIVTQPRRISALSLAERVAHERGEKVGDTVGYHIRLNKCLPQGNGAILYCTTGILLRKILSNKNLEGVSHIIIDEVHERNIQIDLICILLKEILEVNKNVKILLMSASFNTSLFAQYFNSSAVFHVSGKMHPVDEYFLEDLVDKIPSIKNVNPKAPVLDPDLIADTINYIDENEAPGAILCFLPGWHDIRTIHNKILEQVANSKKYLIVPIHSRLPAHEQKNIFLKPSVGQRKVILATNIAETAITINDVAYVVNSGLHKGTVLNAQEGLAALYTQWVTKANVRQRKGRAGRVKPGKCYHLFSWKTFLKMEEYPVAEILRMSLESVILDCKLYCPESKPEEFLLKAIQPPLVDAIQCGIKELQLLRVLDETESLTDLGKTILGFSCHPRLSVALVYSIFLGCLDPVLTICSLLVMEKEPFQNTLDDKLHIREIKKSHDNGLCSDHLALRKIYDTWDSVSEKLHAEESSSEYIEKHLLDKQALIRVKELKELFAAELQSARFLQDIVSYCDSSRPHNMYSSHVPTVLAALTAAFYPNVIKTLQGEINHGKLNKNNLVYSIIKGQKAFIQKESVVSDAEELPTPWLVFFSALNSEARRKAMVSAVSSIPGICLLLLTGKDLTMSHMETKHCDQENLALLTIDNYSKLKFSCTEREARLLLDWRECLFEIFNLYIKSYKDNCDTREHVIFCLQKFVPVLKELLETPQVPLTKGLTYEFVNNELVDKDLWSNAPD